MTQPDQQDSFVLKGGGYKLAGLVLCLLLAVVMLAPALSNGRAGQHVIGGVGVAFFSVAGFRWQRTRVVIDPSGVLLRGLFRTHRLS